MSCKIFRETSSIYTEKIGAFNSMGVLLLAFGVYSDNNRNYGMNRSHISPLCQQRQHKFYSWTWNIAVFFSFLVRLHRWTNKMVGFEKHWTMHFFLYRTWSNVSIWNSYSMQKIEFPCVARVLTVSKDC